MKEQACLEENRNTSKRVKTKEKVRKAALETFRDLGYQKTTVKDIMDRADLGYGTFYQYYKSKQEVLIEFGLEALEGMTKNYKNPPASNTNLFDRTYYSIFNVLETYARYREVLAIIRDCHQMEPELFKLWQKIKEGPFQRHVRDITWSMKRGLCRQVNLNTAIIALSGMVEAVMNYILDNEVSNEELREIAKDVALLYEKAIFAVENIPDEFLRKNA